MNRQRDALDRYSRLVSLLKLVLPLAALALLSTLFLLSRGVEHNATIPFSDADIAERLREQQITAPTFSGTTERGDRIMVEAARARPETDAALARTDEMTGRIVLRSGTRVNISAQAGTLDPDKDQAVFDGNVIISTSKGFEILTETLYAALGRIAVETRSDVSGTSPFGVLTAGKLRLEAQSGGDDAHFLFTDGVKLLYDPKLFER